MFWENIKQYKSEKFKRLTGITLRTFKAMAKVVRKHQEKVIKKKGNKRAHPFSLCIENQILMMLMYYREYRTYYHIGETYGLDESNVGRNIRYIEDILRKDKRFQLLGKEKLSATTHQYQVILVDATESPIERPKKNNSSIIPAKRKNIPLKPS